MENLKQIKSEELFIGKTIINTGCCLSRNRVTQENKVMLYSFIFSDNTFAIFRAENSTLTFVNNDVIGYLDTYDMGYLKLIPEEKLNQHHLTVTKRNLENELFGLENRLNSVKKELQEFCKINDK